MYLIPGNHRLSHSEILHNQLTDMTAFVYPHWLREQDRLKAEIYQLNQLNAELDQHNLLWNFWRIEQQRLRSCFKIIVSPETEVKN